MILPSDGELELVGRGLSWVLQQEAKACPAARKALEELANNPGKLLRPRLLLTLARASCGAKRTASVDTESWWRGLTRRWEARRDESLFHALGQDEPDAWLDERTTGGLRNRTLVSAMALELIHLASLVHDDVVDHSPMRRGRPSVPALVGVEAAVLVGDLLVSVAFGLLNEVLPRSAARVLALAFLLMSRTELESLSQRHGPSTWGKLEMKRFLKQAGRKTGLLFALAFSGGALAEGAPRPTLEDLARSGYWWGLGFQLRDDLLDWYGDSSQEGKPTGLDLDQGIPNLVLVEALATSELEPSTAQLGTWLSASAPESRAALGQALKDLGAASRCRNRAEACWARSLAWARRAFRDRPEVNLTELEEITQAVSRSTPP